MGAAKQEQSLMVHGQKNPAGFAAGAWGDQALPSCVHAREEHCYCCNKAKLQLKVLVCKCTL